MYFGNGTWAGPGTFLLSLFMLWSDWNVTRTYSQSSVYEAGSTSLDTWCPHGLGNQAGPEATPSSLAWILTSGESPDFGVSLAPLGLSVFPASPWIQRVLRPWTWPYFRVCPSLTPWEQWVLNLAEIQDIILSAALSPPVHASAYPWTMCSDPSHSCSWYGLNMSPLASTPRRCDSLLAPEAPFSLVTAK